MRASIFIKINGEINSRELYELLEHLGNINVTDCGQQTLVYGEAEQANIGRIVLKAALFGDISAEITHSRSTSDS
jgi:hypothetical protein